MAAANAVPPGDRVDVPQVEVVDSVERIDLVSSISKLRDHGLDTHGERCGTSDDVPELLRGSGIGISRRIESRGSPHSTGYRGHPISRRGWNQGPGLVAECGG